MNKLNIKDFTNQELINAIVEFLRAHEYLKEQYLLADSLEDGTWLKYFERKLDMEFEGRLNG